MRLLLPLRVMMMIMRGRRRRRLRRRRRQVAAAKRRVEVMLAKRGPRSTSCSLLKV